jgi:hypothetical protein
MRLLGFALIALAITLLASACGGGGTQSLEDYFRDFEEIEQTAEEASAQLADPFDLPPEATLEERHQAVGAFTTAFRDVFGQYREDFEALDPPDEAAAAHDAYGASLATFFAAFEDLLADLARATTVEEYNSPDTQALEAALTKTTADCLALQEIASSNSIDVDLRCNT